MKFIPIILLFIFISLMTQAGEFTGAGKAIDSVLAKHQLSIKELKRSGFKVLDGEITGAGKLVDLSQVHSVVTDKDYIQLNQASDFIYKVGSPAKFIADLEAIEFNQKIIPTKKVKAYFVK